MSETDTILTEEKNGLFAKYLDLFLKNELTAKYFREAMKNIKTAVWRMRRKKFMNRTLTPAWTNPNISAEQFEKMCKQWLSLEISGCETIAESKKEDENDVDK